MKIKTIRRWLNTLSKNAIFPKIPFLLLKNLIYLFYLMLEVKVVILMQSLMELNFQLLNHLLLKGIFSYLKKYHWIFSTNLQKDFYLFYKKNLYFPSFVGNCLTYKNVKLFSRSLDL